MKNIEEMRIEVGRFNNGAVLVHFNNAAGVPYAAIYEGDFEYFSCERNGKSESWMIRTYEKMRNAKMAR